MKLPKQRNYKLAVPHMNTIKAAFIWWITRRNKYCGRFCPTCPYFFKCQEDVELEELMDDGRIPSIAPVAFGILLGLGILGLAQYLSILIVRRFT